MKAGEALQYASSCVARPKMSKKNAPLIEPSFTFTERSTKPATEQREIRQDLRLSETLTECEDSTDATFR